MGREGVVRSVKRRRKRFGIGIDLEDDIERGGRLEAVDSDYSDGQRNSNIRRTGKGECLHVAPCTPCVCCHDTCTTLTIQ